MPDKKPNVASPATTVAAASTNADTGSPTPVSPLPHILPPFLDPDEYTKVLVFMDVSTPDLVDAAARAQSSIQTALSLAADDFEQRIFVRTLVHGYQSEYALEIDSRILRWDRPRGRGQKGFSWGGDSQNRAPVTPSDPVALQQFVEQSLRETPRGDTRDKPYRAILIVWGHGEGVGNRLERAVGSPGALPNRLPATVGGASLLGSIRVALRSALDAVKTRSKAGPEPRPPMHDVFDLVVFDSCLMATSELAFECRGLTQFLIASQSFVMRPGMNVGQSIVEYLRAFEDTEGDRAVDAAKVPAKAEREAPKAASGPQGQTLAASPEQLARDYYRTREGAKAVIDLAGALRSGASQLTLFNLAPQEERLPRRPPATEDSSHGAQATSTPTLAQWLAAKVNEIADETRQSLGAPATNDQGYRAPHIPIGIGGGLPVKEFSRYPWFALMCAFTHLVRWASTDVDEYPRILTAFERTFYVRARQFFDLKDLARQVHYFSRYKPLRIVALELMRELEEDDDDGQGLVVRWRAAIDEKQKQHYGGVSIYCPWFDAEGSEEFDAMVDHSVYRRLDMPRTSGWAGFVLGPMYDATAGRRQREARRARSTHDETVRWLRILKEVMHDGCGGGGPAGSVAGVTDSLEGGPKSTGPNAQIG